MERSSERQIGCDCLHRRIGRRLAGSEGFKSKGPRFKTGGYIQLFLRYIATKGANFPKLALGGRTHLGANYAWRADIGRLSRCFRLRKRRLKDLGRIQVPWEAANRCIKHVVRILRIGRKWPIGSVGGLKPNANAKALILIFSVIVRISYLL
jgi:hypothetical protein